MNSARDSIHELHFASSCERPHLLLRLRTAEHGVHVSVCGLIHASRASRWLEHGTCVLMSTSLLSFSMAIPGPAAVCTSPCGLRTWSCHRLFDGAIIGLTLVLEAFSLGLECACLSWSAVTYPARQAVSMAQWALRLVLRPATPNPSGCMPLHDQRIVIMGASFAGLWSKRNLSPDANVTVIDFKNYFEYTPGVLRAIVQPSHLSNIIADIPQHSTGSGDDVTSNPSFVHGEVVEVRPREVLVKMFGHGGAAKGAASGTGPGTGGQLLRRVPFDTLLVGCGSSYPGPMKPTLSEPTRDSRMATMHTERQRLERSDTILLIGGGPVGVEFAAELVEAFPHKRVTLVGGGGELLGRAFAGGSRQYVTKWLLARGVVLVLGVYVQKKGPGLAIDKDGCTLADGRRLDADLVYTCFGGKPNSGVFARHFGSSITPTGHLLAEDDLQLKACMHAPSQVTQDAQQAAAEDVHSTRLAHHAHAQPSRASPRVFVMGDVMVHPRSSEWKLAHTAEVNAHMVCDNVRRTAEGKPVARYPDGVVGAGHKTPKLYIISLGKYDASLAFNGIVLNGTIAAIAKWLLEWTKVQACKERRIGTLFWQVADAVSVLAGNYVPGLKTRQDVDANP